MRSTPVKRMVAVLLGASLVLGATACGKKAEEASTPTPAPAVVSVTGVDLGRAVGGDKRITDKTERFAPNDVIYASVLTSGSSPSATLKARWLYQDGQVVEETEQPIAPTGDAATEFHISKPDGWPTGKYTLEVSLNGTPVQTKAFEVQ